ncbi:MAG: histidine kinase [Sphingobacteriales bacterium]|nr:histidine kinase [Sphingobacteriales bacterium]
MKKLADTRLVKFYLWTGLGYFLIGFLYTLSVTRGGFFQLLFNNIWAVIYIMALNFILFEYSIPYVLAKKKAIIYNVLAGILLLWVHLMFYSYGSYAWRALGIQLRVYTDLLPPATLSYILQKQMAYSTGSVFVFGIARHIYNYLRLVQAEQRLLIEKQEAELNYLKSQTNPHFLFNTLNNIYSLARDKSDRAPESVLRLSKILRFMLYETGGDYIPIEQEIKIIEDYIALEKLRYDDTLRVHFNYELADMKQALPPLLMIPLVENAFKHGVSETRVGPFVELHLSVKKGQLEFRVKNSTGDSPGEPVQKEGIGLSNLRRQLALLFTDYQLSAEPGESCFTVVLKINLSSHV